MLIFYKSKEQRIKELKQTLEDKIRFYNSNNSCDADWTKAEIIHLLDALQYEKNPVGVFESSSDKIKGIIKSGRINDYEITKNGKIIKKNGGINYGKCIN